MTTESLRVHFMNAAYDAKNPKDIVEAIKILPAGGEKQIPDFVATFCREKGIDPQADELQEYYRQTAEYKTTTETAEKRAALGRTFGELETITKEFRDNESRGAIPTQEQLDIITERIKKHTANLGATHGKRRIYTTTDYMDECLNYDPSKDFTPVLFGGLSFPDGTTSYIGARTTRGKTTAMVNLAREAIMGEISENKRKTIFITLEMSGKQIFNKLILSTAFSMAIAADAGGDPKNRRALMSMNASRDIYTVWKNEELTGKDSNIFRQLILKAYKKICDVQTSGAFILFDGRGITEPEIINFMSSQADKGTVILLDYIQKMPPKPGTDTDSFRRVQAISYDVVNTAAETNAVIIAGAQFNRVGGSDGLGDIFDDQSFREAADLEQDAHNAIGIGWKTDKQGRFYEILKTREDKKQGTLFDLDFAGGYSYMSQAGQIFRPEGGRSKTKSKEQETENGREKSQVIHSSKPL